MGKYMRRCGREIGEVAVMEVTQAVGVKTRARALALAAADAEAPPRSAAGAKRRRVEGGGELCVSYLQLRSRSLILKPAKTRRAAAAAAAAAHSSGTAVPLRRTAGGGECDRVSRCSSNTSGGELAASVAPAAKMTSSRSGFLAPEVDDGSETTACNYDGDHQRWREQTPLSEAGERETDDLESTARPSESGGPRLQDAASAPAGTELRMPSEAEIAEFFAAAEEQEHKRFADKYNYDVVKDVPLQGRYDWMQIKP